MAASLLIGLATLAIASLVLLVRARSRVEPSPFAIGEVADESSQVPAFLLTYLFPFVSLSVGSVWDGAAYAIFVVILFAVLLRTDLMLINPLLLLAGFRVYRAHSLAGTELMLFAGVRLKKGDEVVGAPIDSGAARFIRFANKED